MNTDNGRRAIALGGELYLKQNTYRITAVYARGNLNYDLYGLGSGNSPAKLPLRQTGQLVFGEFLRRTWWKLFLGPRFLRGSSLVTVRPSDVGTIPLPPDVGLDTTLTALGFRVDRDTRPNRFYPTEGAVLDLAADFFSEGLGSKYSFESYQFTFSKYWGLTPNQVLASGSFACLTRGASLPSTETAFTAQTANCADTLPVAISIVTCLGRSWNIGWPYRSGSALWGLAAWEK